MTTCAEIPAPNGAKHQGRIPADQDEAEWQSGLRDRPLARIEFGLTDHGLPTLARMPSESKVLRALQMHRFGHRDVERPDPLRGSIAAGVPTRMVPLVDR
jgi:hypothetical protein